MDFKDEDNSYKVLNPKVNVVKVGTYKGRHGVTLDSLSQKWVISTEAARRTVQHKTKQGISTTLHPDLLRLINTNDRTLRHNRLQHSVFIDTMQAGTFSMRVNWYAQVYSTKFGWSRAHPMKRKGY